MSRKHIFFFGFAFVCVAALGFNFFLADCPTYMERLRIQGQSMRGVFEEGDRIYFEMDPRHCLSLKQGDTVLVETGENHPPLSKQLVALPGDEVFIDDDTHCPRLRISGSGQDLSSAQCLAHSQAPGLRRDLARSRGIMPPDFFLVMGTSATSFDSRAFGFVPRHHIRGRATELR